MKIIIAIFILVISCKKNNISEENIKSDTIEYEGKILFERFACNACHSIDGSTHRGPTMKNLFDKKIFFENGDSIQYDENYVIESIMEPNKSLIQGYMPIMPKYNNILTIDDCYKIIAYIKILK